MTARVTGDFRRLPASNDIPAHMPYSHDLNYVLWQIFISISRQCHTNIFIMMWFSMWLLIIIGVNKCLFATFDKLSLEAEINFITLNIDSSDGLEIIKCQIQWNLSKQNLHVTSCCVKIINDLFKDWSQFFFGSWRNKLKNVVHTV